MPRLGPGGLHGVAAVRRKRPTPSKRSTSCRVDVQPEARAALICGRRSSRSASSAPSSDSSSGRANATFAHGWFGSATPRFFRAVGSRASGSPSSAARSRLRRRDRGEDLPAHVHARALRPRAPDRGRPRRQARVDAHGEVHGGGNLRGARGRRRCRAQRPRLRGRRYFILISADGRSAPRPTWARKLDGPSASLRTRMIIPFVNDQRVLEAQFRALFNEQDPRGERAAVASLAMRCGDRKHRAKTFLISGRTCASATSSRCATARSSSPPPAADLDGEAADGNEDTSRRRRCNRRDPMIAHGAAAALPTRRSACCRRRRPCTT